MHNAVTGEDWKLKVGIENQNSKLSWKFGMEIELGNLNWNWKFVIGNQLKMDIGH